MTRRRVAALMWIATVAYWPMQVLVARSWSTPYDWRGDVISALGAATCAEYCSPDHALMNATFVGVGALTAGGGVLLARSRTGTARTGYVLLTVSSVAVCAVGFLPMDVDPVPHTVAAQVHFAAHVAGMLFLAHGTSGWRRLLTVGAAAVALAGGIAFVWPGHLGLGAGVTERIALDTLRMWTIGAGVALLWPDGSRSVRA